MKKFGISALVIASFIASSAYAATSQDQGFYGVVTAGISKTNGDLGVKDGNGVSLDRISPSLSIGAGYSINKNVAAELNYARLGEVRYQVMGASIPQNNSMYSVSLVVSQPFAQDISLFGRVGAADTYAELLGASVHRTSAMLGVGAEYAINDRFAIRGEIQYIPDYAFKGPDVVNAAVGLKVKF
jgi:opacity protein-like surface antigen